MIQITSPYKKRFGFSHFFKAVLKTALTKTVAKSNICTGQIDKLRIIILTT